MYFRKIHARGAERMKGLSPLIATVLLIAFTIAVGGLISIWITGFTQTQTQSVGSQATTQITCSNGGIAISSVGFCNSYLTARLSNIGSISLGNLSLIIVFQNASNTQNLYLQQQGSIVNVSSSCCSNLTIQPNGLTSFNVTIGGSNYDTIKVVSNCTGVVASIDSSSVAKTC